jgi:two-component system sensor histidine kinase and response regulator WspE
MLELAVEDDGRGLDPARIRAKVVERGLASAALAERMTDAELFEFLFLPGFSTRDTVTQISGRGVGLDVVQSLVQTLGGSVRVASKLGKRTRFELLLPITRSIVRSLLVEIAGEPYAFPLSRIDRIDKIPPSRVEWLEGRPFVTYDGQAVGLVEATQVLDLPDSESKIRDDLSVVVLSDRGHRFGVIVDRFLGEDDLNVRPLDPRLGKVPDVGSASLLGDGRTVLIFDVEDFVRSIDNRLTGRRRTNLHGERRTESAAVPRILVVDDSITVRELERQMLTARGYEVEVAVDGMDAWNAVRGGDYQLVVSDVDMPRMDGIELIRRIRADQRLRDLPVVIVSYKDRVEDRLRGLDAGANAYLTKSSFHDHLFLRTVVDLIGEAARA